VAIHHLQEQQQRRKTAFISCICLSFGLLSTQSFANQFAECLESQISGLSEAGVHNPAAKVFWTSVLKDQSLVGRGLRLPQGSELYFEADLALDASNLDSAVMSLIQGQSFGATSAFQRVFHKWNEFVPMLQGRVKQLSKGQVELRPFSSAEEKAIGAESDARYFKLIRQSPRGSEEEAVKLTQEGVIVLPLSELSAPRKSHGIFSQGSTTGHHAFLSKPPLMGAGASPLERNVEKEAHHLDRAISSILKGESYGVATLGGQAHEVKSARAAFDRLYQSQGQPFLDFVERVKQLSDGKAELIPISAEKAGVSVVGYGRYFELVLQTNQGTETHVVELTSEGFSILPAIEKKR
jgi:hypothetical protein